MTGPSHGRIVLVDDDESLRRALARTMRVAGYAVESYGTADELVRAGVACAGACLVLDISLPGTSGADFRRSLSAAGEEPPTIFITALDRIDAEAALGKLAPFAVLYKPFRNDELLAAIHGACGAPGSAPPGTHHDGRHA